MHISYKIILLSIVLILLSSCASQKDGSIGDRLLDITTEVLAEADIEKAADTTIRSTVAQCDLIKSRCATHQYNQWRKPDGSIGCACNN